MLFVWGDRVDQPCHSTEMISASNRHTNEQLEAQRDTSREYIRKAHHFPCDSLSKLMHTWNTLPQIPLQSHPSVAIFSIRSFNLTNSHLPIWPMRRC